MRDEEIQRILRGRDVETVAREMEHAEWVQGLASWDIFFTGTFRWTCSEASAQRIFERWVGKVQPGVPTLYGLDPNPSGDGGHHVHGLLASSDAYRKALWEDWFNRYGRARLEPIANIGGVSGYVAKYPLTGARWWNVLNCTNQKPTDLVLS